MLIGLDSDIICSGVNMQSISELQRQYQQDKRVESFIKLLVAKQRAGKIVLAAWGESKSGFLHPIHYNFEPFEALRQMAAYSSLPDYSDRLQIQMDEFGKLESILPKCKECGGAGGLAYESHGGLEWEPEECFECALDIPGFDVEAIMTYPWGHGQDVSGVNRFYILYDKDIFFILRDSKQRIEAEIAGRTEEEQTGLASFYEDLEAIEDLDGDDHIYPDIEYYITYIDHDASYAWDNEYEIDYEAIRRDVESRSIEEEIRKYAILIVDEDKIDFADKSHHRVWR